jgi:hypothetical protein
MAFVAKYMIVEGFGWGGWPMAGPVPLLLAVAAVRRRRRDEATTACGVTLLLQLFVLYGVYLMTPHSVAWHLATSWDRLVAQMWPGAVWWAFNATHAPADVRH